MEIVIKISEENREKIKHAKQGIFIDLYGIMETAINNGTPLPKGHGDLVDRGTYFSALEERIKGWKITTTELHDKVHGIAMARNICNGLKPIIEADKESE